MADVETFAMATVSNACFMASISSTLSPRPCRPDVIRLVERAQHHLLAAAAAGQQADADFDQSHVEFGVRLASRARAA